MNGIWILYTSCFRWKGLRNLINQCSNNKQRQSFMIRVNNPHAEWSTLLHLCNENNSNSLVPRDTHRLAHVKGSILFTCVLRKIASLVICGRNLFYSCKEEHFAQFLPSVSTFLRSDSLGSCLTSNSFLWYWIFLLYVNIWGSTLPSFNTLTWVPELTDLPQELQ